MLFGPPALPPPRRSALLVVVRPSSSSLGPRPRRPALVLVIRPYAPSFGPPPHPWAYLRHDGALRVAVEPLALSFGPFASLLGRSRCRLGPPRCCWAAHVIPGLLGEKRGLVGGGEREKGENEPRQKSWPVFATHLLGLPLPGSPLVFLPSYPPVEPDGTGPHPSGEGRGGCGWKATIWSELG